MRRGRRAFALRLLAVPCPLTASSLLTPSSLLTAILLLAGCASAPARTALSGNLPALKAAIEQADQQKKLGASGLSELAGAVLERELVSLSANDDAFPDVAACARNIRPALENVARSSSEYAAPAALALMDAGFAAPPSTADTTVESVRARQAVGAHAGARRRALMLHADVNVRLAALAAARASSDPADTAALAEAARLDPDPDARLLAIRALGRIGGAAAVLALVDVYASATPLDRRAIVLAWSTPRSFDAGGRERLEDLTPGSDRPSVLAAVALEARAPESSLASARLVRAIQGSEVEARLLAIEAAPWSDAAVRAAIEAARKHADPATRVLALWRVAALGALDAAGVHDLEQLATDPVTAVGAVARAALARAGKASVTPALRVDLAAKAADRRTLAALALFELKDFAGAARALGDDSPRVRRAVACQVLADPDTPPQLAWSLTAEADAGGVVPLLLSSSAS